MEHRRELEKSCGDLMGDYWDEINSAFLETEGPFSISFKITLSPGAGRQIDYKTSMSFVASRVKDTIERTLNDPQLELFPTKEPGE